MIYNAIHIGVFQGTDFSVLRDRFEFEGPLLKQFYDVYQKIEMYNWTRSEVEGLYRIDMKDYPDEVIREALLHAFAYRDYSIEAPMLISIFDDRIEIVAVGGACIAANSELAKLLCIQKHAESDMYGIARMRKCYEKEAVKPGMEVSSNAFKIVLPNMNHDRESAVV